MRWEASEKRIGIIRLELWLKRITWVAKLITLQWGHIWNQETSLHRGWLELEQWEKRLGSGYI